ncbi:uncharacterized protein STEHIDRAFT_117773 [Stereum hirsutum FP-91666 SS1]|uniref:uncharacterized protein n=1 Tax=Stereum hirsutum (strain FP-91666) TaxID=721885 RepID=UPI000440B27E|nr:uncharacterized protein STEHIDRAFT_117773 [Stereum hirsutum FP-91666 SS1]EIM92811.1 hypothetical protein STEHIDRAFT_117773 [Stereum hirsutum FP-91666 SS1]
MNSALAPEMPTPMPTNIEPSAAASSSTSPSSSSPSPRKQQTFGQSFLSTLNLLLNTPLVPPPPVEPMEVQLQEMPSSRSSYLGAQYGQGQDRRGSMSTTRSIVSYETSAAESDRSSVSVAGHRRNLSDVPLSESDEY